MMPIKHQEANPTVGIYREKCYKVREVFPAHVPVNHYFITNFLQVKYTTGKHHTTKIKKYQYQ